MPNKQPFVTTLGSNPRQFVTVPVALQAIIVNSEEKILLLSSPTRKLGWQLVTGAMEADETVLEGTRREVAEEVGPDVRVKPLGSVHAQSFRYDENVPYMLSHFYLFSYEGGSIVPGDDMIGSEFRWWALDELEDDTIHFHVTAQAWILNRAIQLYRLWRNEPERPLQPPVDEA